MKHSLRLGFTLFAAVLVLAGCGSSDSAPPTTAETQRQSVQRGEANARALANMGKRQSAATPAGSR